VFERVPAGVDAYLLSFMVHDWEDEQAVALLRSCRRAMGPNGRVLRIEEGLPPGDTPSMSKLLDLQMLVATGGQERSEADYRALLKVAGFRLTRVIPTGSPRSIVEGAPI
jgi:hypothetical protein